MTSTGVIADVVVVGGGPAGAAAAVTLARGGRSVVLVTRDRRHRPRIGETLPPSVIRPLVALGVWDTFLAAGHLASPGTVASWGDGRPRENDFIVDPHGTGWHVDRDRFDSMLLDAARAEGARILALPRAARVDREHPGWTVRWERGTVCAPFLVDASGRGARVASRYGGPQRGDDRLVGLVRFGRAHRPDPRTLIEACPEGWWYAAALPGGRAVTALFTDADVLPAGSEERRRFRARALSHTHLVAEVVGESTCHLAPADARVAKLCAGRDWVAVGDAARTLDPLSGQGLTVALTSAIRAAEAVLDRDSGGALAAFAADTAAGHRAHVAAGLAHYRRERRWPESAFWRRRHRTAA
ncbi:NAD(P)/FAD-dependent oxidoreductase [Pseudonocardia eucalypti]|uniref:NAD(P)/FAD-dependent oxidoreductase n=1 Tax=Pseudonocardia eucalypti TaxID=648755 RepID=A0ABP9PN85_9PSEU|nr:flavin-dependent dehydrogenase [Pseudonocardia eucalypti]